MHHSWVGSAAHPPSVVPKKMWRGGGATGGVEGNPTMTTGARRSKGAYICVTTVDKSRIERADRVARHQANCSIIKNILSYSCLQLLKLVRA